MDIIKENFPNFFKSEVSIYNNANINQNKVNTIFGSIQTVQSIELNDEEPSELDKLLEEINLYSYNVEREIKKEPSPHEKYIQMAEAIELGKKEAENGYKNEYFVLSVLAQVLQYQGCKVVIERGIPKDINEKKKMIKCLQYLVNGMNKLKKYTLTFASSTLDYDFKKNLQKKLAISLYLDEKDILITKEITDRTNTEATVSAIIKKNKFFEFSQDQLVKELYKDHYFSKIRQVKKSILLSACKLNPNMLYSKVNNRDGGWGKNEKRGGKIYYPPIGWVGYGLNVVDAYEDNIWLGYQNIGEEWSVAYNGIGTGLIDNKSLSQSVIQSGIININEGISGIFLNTSNMFNDREMVGEGVIVSPNPEIMEKCCGNIIYNYKKYKIGFMSRVNPKKIRSPLGKSDYWVINGFDDEIRPYRILIKEV